MKRDQGAEDWNWDLRRGQQGDAGDGGPGLFMRHQFVLHQPVHTVGLHHTALIELILLWCTSSCEEKKSKERLLKVHFTLDAAFQVTLDKKKRIKGRKMAVLSLCVHTKCVFSRDIWKVHVLLPTSVLCSSSQKAPEVCGHTAVRVQSLLQVHDLGSRTTEVPLALDEGSQLRGLISRIKYSI